MMSVLGRFWGKRQEIGRLRPDTEKLKTWTTRTISHVRKKGVSYRPWPPHKDARRLTTIAGLVREAFCTTYD